VTGRAPEEITMRERDNGMLLVLIGGLAGAALMFFLDPERGSRRRHLAGDKAKSSLRTGGRRVRGLAEDLRNRTSGAAAEARARIEDLSGRERVLDDVLVARVRAELGRHTRHVRAIEVSAADGTVTLRGPILAEEAGEVLAAVEKVPGILGVENRLDVHADAGNMPSLQG
jgi:osmotically-inducible protein OsmY